MARKILLDVDPGIDDAMALALALWDDRLEVAAATATGGNVSPSQATRNLQAVIEQVDPPRWPRIGAALEDQMLLADAREIHGANGLGGAEFRVAELHHQHRSDKIISDCVRSAPGEVTLLMLGPLTNLAAVLKREPDLAGMIGHLVIRGGSIMAPGNATAIAEFNVYCDPEAARTVFRSPITKTLIPLDVTQQVLFTYDLLDKLPAAEKRTGALLRQILPGVFRSYHQRLGLEGVYLHDVVGLVAALHPELFTTEALPGDVETDGILTKGFTVFDRRRITDDQPNMDVATEVDAAAVVDCVLRGLAEAA
jgi:purine nucleosidase